MRKRVYRHVLKHEEAIFNLYYPRSRQSLTIRALGAFVNCVDHGSAHMLRSGLWLENRRGDSAALGLDDLVTEKIELFDGSLEYLQVPGATV
ncbi:hypothetical protein RFN29_26875 [Mesorhizobium sp. VK22B]|uniref:Uncharacterized protein n=1 Tax=Mesorhizobium captivum TaxID=3072319 RepID=A0ABU4ZB44_9HYPH|nr:hypothetical protein [Mesorhizobium sp. VK22B]MDX8495187.1 hypothetical protein [Mesorhizobium sp. VK22B]